MSKTKVIYQNSIDKRTEVYHFNSLKQLKRRVIKILNEFAGWEEESRTRITDLRIKTRNEYKILYSTKWNDHHIWIWKGEFKDEETK